MAKGLKLKVRKYWELIPTSAGEKLVGGTFYSPPWLVTALRLGDEATEQWYNLEVTKGAITK